MFRYTKRTLVLEIFTILVALVLLTPFWILIVTSLKSGQDILTTPAFAPPKSPTLDNFKTLLSPSGTASDQIVSGLKSSAIITAGSIIGLVVFGSVTAYGLVRGKSRWTTRSYFLFLIAIILPTQLGVLPLYVEARKLGLVGSEIGMIIIYTGVLLPLSVFLYAGFFRTLPPEYEEAARIDGASPVQTFVRVVFPLMAPATGTVSILAGLIVWNDFFTPLIFLNGTDKQTLPVVMYNFVGALVSQWNLIFAIVLISMVPILAFYVIAQKKFIQGFSGGIKT
ncbi:carbohydrate ABC transporter permease [Marmoricola sp. URHB0036]|uniref:carbohydrate ABC transporter permease n=1 Tax=Marmoricola sp. URHB0036 TaxID=1298863 RepID=UPI000405C366|nr:carbohydrate ABC transporter permease [Marmoricola sp. URHB0036]